MEATHKTAVQRFYSLEFTPFPRQEPFIFKVKEKRHRIKLHTVEYPHEGKQKGVIFFACGYGETVDMYGGYFEEFAKQGYRIFSYDYRGFGLSPGEPAVISGRASKDFVAFIDLVVAEYDLFCA